MNRKRNLVVAIVFFGLLVASPVWGASLAWDAVTQNVDGTVITDLAGYRVYRCDIGQTCPGTQSLTRDVGLQTTLDLLGLGMTCHSASVACRLREGVKEYFSAQEEDFLNEKRSSLP